MWLNDFDTSFDTILECKIDRDVMAAICYGGNLFEMNCECESTMKK